MKQYIFDKYEGFKKIESDRIRDELLLNKREWMLLRKKLRTDMGVKGVPTYLTLDEFAEIVAEELVD